MSKQVIIGFNPVTAKIFSGPEKANLIASSVLSYIVEGYEHTDAGRSGGWDGRSTFFDWNGSQFPRGFVSMVERELRGHGYDVKLINRPLPIPLGPAEPKIDEFGYGGRYDYQWNTSEELLKRGRMIARVATGGGKSRIAKICHARINRPTLFLTTRKALMYQMKKGFEASGWKVGVMGDSVWEPNGHLDVAMVQTLAARLQEPAKNDKSPEAERQRRVREKTIEILGNVEFLIGEEAHEASGNSYYEVIRQCRKAEYALALTATPFMRQDAEANMKLMSTFGEVGIEVSEEMLIARGILARPVFKYIDNPCPKKLRRTTPWQRAVELGIVTDEWRNEEVVNRVKAGKAYGLTTMVLVARKNHGIELSKLMREQGIRAVFLFGATSQAKREKALEGLRRGLIDVIIGSTILDVGVDVPSVGQIILAGGGQDEIQLRQRIGRGLREKKGLQWDGVTKMPNVCPIFDFRDRHNKHLQNHAITRQQVVRKTPGFAENVLEEDQDINYAALGFKRVA